MSGRIYTPTGSKGGGSMAYNEAAKRAAIKYMEKAYDRIVIKVKKGHKQEIAAHAAEIGMSVNAYITGLIDEDMKRGEW